MDIALHFSSKTDDWATPQDLFDRLNAEFRFNLDPCASEDNHKCDTFFTEKDDGLSKDWIIDNVQGHVFMNPPYGREIGKWIEKAVHEVKIGHANKVVALLPARTDTKWFHDYCLEREVRFLKGRVKFGDGKNSAPFPSMIVIFN